MPYKYRFRRGSKWSNPYGESLAKYYNKLANKDSPSKEDKEQLNLITEYIEYPSLKEFIQVEQTWTKRIVKFKIKDGKKDLYEAEKTKLGLIQPAKV